VDILSTDLLGDEQVGELSACTEASAAFAASRRNTAVFAGVWYDKRLIPAGSIVHVIIYGSVLELTGTRVFMIIKPSQRQNTYTRLAAC
jgi:hypothetical protein